MDKITYYSNYGSPFSKERMIETAHRLGKAPPLWNAIDNKFVRIHSSFNSKVIRDDFDCTHWTLCLKYWSLKNIKEQATISFQNGIAVKQPLPHSAEEFLNQLAILHQYLTVACNILDLLSKEIQFIFWQNKILASSKSIKYSQVRNKINRSHFSDLDKQFTNIRVSRCSKKIISVFSKNSRFRIEIDKVIPLRNLYMHNSLPMFSGNAILLPRVVEGKYITYMNNQDWLDYFDELEHMSHEQLKNRAYLLPEFFSNNFDLFHDCINEVYKTLLIG